MLTIDSNHNYLLDGDKIPGVHEIVGKLKLIDFSVVDENVLKQAIELGTGVHLASEQEEMGLEYDKTYQKYIDSINEFKKEFGVKKTQYCEYKCYSDYGFACTIDRVFELEDGSYWIVDYKTGGKYRVTRLQTAANKIALKYMSGIDAKRGVLYLNKEGGYQFKEHNDKYDLDVWIGLVKGFHWTNPRYSKKEWRKK